MPTDPRSQVEAPIRAALAGVMARGFVLVGIVGVLAVWPAVAHPPSSVADAVAMVTVAVLFGYCALVRIARYARLRFAPDAPSEDDLELAWDRAREVDSEGAALSLLVAGWVPAALFLALGVLLWPHVTDPNPALAAAWVVLGLPPIAMAWMVATATWLEACRDDLARAEHESDVLLRRYWSNVGH